MEKERQIFFIKLRKGVKDGKPWFFVDYIDLKNLQAKSDYITAIDYDRISKKAGDKHLFETTGILGINQYDRVYIADLK